MVLRKVIAVVAEPVGELGHHETILVRIGWIAARIIEPIEDSECYRRCGRLGHGNWPFSKRRRGSAAMRPPGLEMRFDAPEDRRYREPCAGDDHHADEHFVGLKGIAGDSDQMTEARG
jgi:hypothetical protein